MGNTQNAHLDRHGSRASSSSDVSSLGGNRNSRALDNVSLLSVDAILTPYERHAFNELEAQAQADYSHAPSAQGDTGEAALFPMNPPPPPGPATGHCAEPAQPVPRSISPLLPSAHPITRRDNNPVGEDDAAKWQEWTANDDNDNVSESELSEEVARGYLAASTSMAASASEALPVGHIDVSTDYTHTSTPPPDYIIHNDSAEDIETIRVARNQVSNNTELLRVDPEPDYSSLSSEDDEIDTHSDAEHSSNYDTAHTDTGNSGDYLDKGAGIVDLVHGVGLQAPIHMESITPDASVASESVSTGSQEKVQADIGCVKAAGGSDPDVKTEEGSLALVQNVTVLETSTVEPSDFIGISQPDQEVSSENRKTSISIEASSGVLLEGLNHADSSPSQTEESEDDVFSGSTTDIPLPTTLSRSPLTSLDDLLDCLQETPVDELVLSGHKKSAEIEMASSHSSLSPSPPPILTPPPVSNMARFAHLNDEEIILVSDLPVQDYPHLMEMARSEPRSEPVTDLDDDSDDDFDKDFQSEFFNGLDDPEKSATRDEMSRILMAMQNQFGAHNEEDGEDSEGALQEMDRKASSSRESVSSGGEYDTATMKIKRDISSDSDSSDDETSGFEAEANEPDKYLSSSDEDEIIQHIMPELFDKVINSDNTKIDLLADPEITDEFASANSKDEARQSSHFVPSDHDLLSEPEMHSDSDTPTESDTNAEPGIELAPPVVVTSEEKSVDNTDIVTQIEKGAGDDDAVLSPVEHLEVCTASIEVAAGNEPPSLPMLEPPTSSSMVSGKPDHVSIVENLNQTHQPEVDTTVEHQLHAVSFTTIEEKAAEIVQQALDTAMFEAMSFLPYPESEEMIEDVKHSELNVTNEIKLTDVKVTDVKITEDVKVAREGNVTDVNVTDETDGAGDIRVMDEKEVMDEDKVLDEDRGIDEDTVTEEVIDEVANSTMISVMEESTDGVDIPTDSGVSGELIEEASEMDKVSEVVASDLVPNVLSIESSFLAECESSSPIDEPQAVPLAKSTKVIDDSDNVMNCLLEASDTVRSASEDVAALPVEEMEVVIVAESVHLSEADGGGDKEDGDDAVAMTTGDDSLHSELAVSESSQRGDDVDDENADTTTEDIPKVMIDHSDEIVNPPGSVVTMPDDEKDHSEKELVSEVMVKSPNVDTRIVDVKFTEEELVLGTVTDEGVESLRSDAISPSLGSAGSTPPEPVPGQRTLDVIEEEEQVDDSQSESGVMGTGSTEHTHSTESMRSVSAVISADCLPAVSSPKEYVGYSNQQLRLISKKYPFKPLPKDPEAQRVYQKMMRQIEADMQKMLNAPKDSASASMSRSDRIGSTQIDTELAHAAHSLHRERKSSVPPPSRLTMQTPVPPPSAQAASRPSSAAPHPALVPIKSKELSRKELKRRESENRKSKKQKKKVKKTNTEKENESRMAQFAAELSNFMKLGSLSKEHGKTDTKKEEKEEQRLPHSPPQSTAPATAVTGDQYRVLRLVVIHRNERGYGLTVSGDNPVYVQSVKENGAAALGGVQNGDQIVKVNGTLVSSSNHIEVVKLIKSGPYVSLTLLGRATGGRGGPQDGGLPPGGPGSPPLPPDTGSDRITCPQPVNDTMNMELQNQKVAFTRMMYEKATSQYEKMKAEGHLTEPELSDQLRTIRRLEAALYDLTGIPAESHLPGGPRQRKLDSGSDATYGDDVPHRDATVTRTHSDSRKRSSHPGHDGGDITHEKSKATSLPANVAETGDPAAHSPSPGKEDGPQSDSNDDNADVGYYDESGPPIIPMMPAVTEGGPYSPNQFHIFSAEDDFSDEEEGQLEEHGPFSDLNALKRKPSHLAVFLNYLISNSDPSPLLFYLVTDNYANGTTKEMKKWAYEIHSTFLVNKAPLRVNVEDQIVANIDNTLLTKSDKVDVIQSAFGLARHHVQNEISELLADFRNKCALGLGSLYGTHEISTKDTMERSKELHLVEKYLVPHFERLLANEDSSDRNQAMAYALATVLKQVGCTLSGKTATILERCPSFVAKDKKTFKLQPTRRKWVVRDHTFVPSSYYSSTQCHQCSKNIWGIGVQGYQCSVCEMNVHKQCVENVKETCSAGHNKRKTKRTSSIMSIIRKPSTVTQPQISSKESARWSDDGYTSPGSSSTFLRSHKDDDDEESDRLRPSSQTVELSPRIIDEARSPGSPPRARSPDFSTDPDAEQRKHVVRSESLKGKQEAKSKTVRRSQSDLHVDDPNIKTVLNQSGSDTSIGGSLESPSNSSELLHDHRGLSGESHWVKPVREEVRSDDSDIDVENELPPLSASIPADLIKKLKPKEKKRQDVMNELLHTERTHVRTLKVMHGVFYVNLADGLAPDLALELFPNIDELIKVHSTLNKEFKLRKQENPLVSHVGDLLLGSFAGEAGEKFKEVCAQFCRNQSHGLETLRVRQRKDQKLAMFLQQEASSNPLCRRLELKDLIPTVMQRLTKYPLLIENLLQCTQTGSEEHSQLKMALICSRNILSYVNEAVKEAENEQKLMDIERRLDKRSFENSTLPMVAEYKNLILTKHKMVYDGPLTWHIGRSKQIELHVVLLENMLVLLQRQDDKYVLKCSTTVILGREDSHSPVLKLSNVLARNVAINKRAFFLVCTSDIGPQIYELHAMSTEEKNKWLRYISEAVEAYKERTSTQPNKTPTVSPPEDKHVRKESKEELPGEGEELERLRSSSVDSLEKVTVHQATNQAELIQPTEVVISETVLEEAEPVLSPREMLKRKDVEVRRSLEEKDRLVAEILNVPATDYVTIAEMASDIEGEKDVRELVLGATYQTSRLTQLVNDSLKVEEDVGEPVHEAVSPTVGTASAGHVDDKPVVTVTLTSSSVLDVTRKLNEQLSLLLGLVGEQEEVNKRLQHDLDMANEQLALTRDVTHRSPSISLSHHSRPNSFASITSSTSEVTETPEDGQHLLSSSEETGLFLVTGTPQDVAVTTACDDTKLEVVEGDDANHNMAPSEQTEHTATILTDANLNAASPDNTSRRHDTPPTT